MIFIMLRTTSPLFLRLASSAKLAKRATFIDNVRSSQYILISTFLTLTRVDDDTQPKPDWCEERDDKAQPSLRTESNRATLLPDPRGKVVVSAEIVS